MNKQTPHAEGATAEVPLLDQHGFVRKYELPLGAARALHELATDYQFFTPAVLYLYGNFLDSMWLELMRDLNREVRLYYRCFQNQMFSGLEAKDGDQAWNHVLWAVHRADWPALESHLLSMLLSFREEGRVIRYGLQVLTVPDPLAGWGSLAVSVFGVNGSDALWAFEGTTLPGEPVLQRLPRLRRLPPEGSVVAQAEALFAEKPLPPLAGKKDLYE